MKTTFTILSFLILSLNLNAQCTTGCTFNVSGLSTSDFYVTTGQKLCISATGTITGIIAVDGGTLCNQGTIKTTNVLVANGGTFNNYGKGIIDTLYIYQTASAFNNYGIMTNSVIGTAANAQTNNSGTLITTLLGDSIGTFINTGNLTINQDFYNAYSSSFTNNGYMNVGRDFYNASNSIFATQCMVNVSRDWYNAASVLGATSGCGGFNITNNSFNAGTVGNTSTHLDLCDANNTGSINGNTGTIAGTTTYCSCASSACNIVGLNEENKKFSFFTYPNPTNGLVTIETSEEIKKITITNYLGQLVEVTPTLNNHKTQLDLSKEPAGLYTIQCVGNLGVVAYKKIIKE